MLLKSGSDRYTGGHPWHMSIEAWALAVALFSAVGTVANMVASWSTYRRIRPRGEVDAKWVIFGAHEWEDPMGIFLVDITNTSQSEIRVRTISLRIDLAPQEFMPVDSRPHYTALEVVKGEVGEPIPAMGEMNLQVEPNGMRWELIPYVRRVRVEVTLTRKTKMASKWMSKKDQVWFEFDELMKTFKALAAHLGYGATPHRQLSFDEVEESE